MRVVILLLAVLGSMAATGRAQLPVPAPDEQIAAAVLPLPGVLRPGAGVRGYADAATPVTLREGTNGIVCMGDRPGDDEFDVRCYDRDFLAVMDRWRELMRSGMEDAAAEERLSREVAEGSLPMPDHPTAGYRMLGPIAAYDPASGSFTDAIEKWQSVHLPYRTAEEIGIPTEPERAMPYVMASGTWWAHVMIEHPSHDDPDTIEEEAMTTRAAGTFDVSLTPQPASDADGATIGRMSIAKTFQGDLEATSGGQMIAAQGGVEGSAGYVAIEEVHGTLHGRRGAFLLQHTGTMTRGEPSLSVTVVPDSGTDQLIGLAGTMSIEIAEDGTHSYEFDYTIPEASREAVP